VLVELLPERVARQVVAGGVAPYVELPSFKSLGELLGKSLLVELLSSTSSRWIICSSRPVELQSAGRVSGRVTAERVAQSSVRDSFGKSLGDSLEELLPVSDNGLPLKICHLRWPLERRHQGFTRICRHRIKHHHNQVQGMMRSMAE
jgi:hypothetical protein